MASGDTTQQPAAHAAAAWRRSGFMKGLGIPAPSGPYEVGCVDVLLPCKQEENAAAPSATDLDTVLMRLFYPTNSTSRASAEDYSKWFPHPKYVGAYSDSQGWKVSGLWSTMMKGFTTPRMPALLGAALIDGSSKAVPEESKPDKPASGTDKDGEASNEDKPTVSRESEETGGKETEQTSSEPAKSETESTPPSLGPFPVIIFSHDARHMRTAYSAICCDLASHGYMVASVEHRDQSACLSLNRVLVGTPQEGRQQRYQEEWVNYQASKNATEQLQVRVKEVRRALDLIEMLNEGKEMTNLLQGRFDLQQFKNRLRMDTVAAIGHSMGGATVVQTLFSDQRIKCGIGLDALLSQTVPDEVFSEGINQPLLFVNSFSFLTIESVRLMKNLRKDPDETSKFSPCQILTIKGTLGQSLSDVFFALPDLFVSGSQPSVNPQTTHSLIVGLCHSFLKRFLLKDLAYQEQTIPNLDGGEGASELIIFGTNVQEPETATASENASSDQPGAANPAEDIATVVPEASHTASHLEEETKDEQQGQEEADSEQEKVEKLSDKDEEGSGEAAGEKESHPGEDQPQVDEDQPQLDEEQLQADKDQPQLDEVQPQLNEEQPQPEGDDEGKEKSAEDEQPHSHEVEGQPSQQHDETPNEGNQDKEDTHGSEIEEQPSEEQEEKSGA